MPTPPAETPETHGLFETYVSRGQQLFEDRHYLEAARQLEEACLLRPREPRALNLLGQAYFKGHEFGKAEEVYRKLVAESPDTATLHYNLGLVYLKLQRLDDAELAFVKSVDLAGPNPKVHYYLGSIYEQLRRFQDAIHQYRLAGAHIQVRRVEDRIPEGASRAAPRRSASPSDTAEYRAADIRAAIDRTDLTLPITRPPTAVTPELMAPGAPGRAHSGDTKPFRVPPDLPEPLPQPAAPAPTPPAAVVPPAATAPPAQETKAPEPTAEAAALSALLTQGPFSKIQAHLLEAAFSGKLFIKQGTLYSYSGNLTFWVKDRRPGGRPALVIVTGSGRLMLTDKDSEVELLQVRADQRVCVEPSHLLACEEAVNPVYVALAPAGPEVLRLEGAGGAAITVRTRPFAMPITPDMPVSVPLSSVVHWTGDVTARPLEDTQLLDVLAAGGQGEMIVRLEGRGQVLVEQAVE